MLIKNLELSFDRQENGKMIFKTETGAEITIADHLLDVPEDKSKQVYFCLDQKPLPGSDEDKKQLLNELIDDESNQ